MDGAKKEIALLLGKTWMWLVLIFIGVIAKFSYDVSIKKKFTFATFVSTLFLAAFIGYLASVFCANKGWVDAGKIIVPVATLLSEKILQIIISNGHKWFKKFLLPPKDEE